jgi:hypothetical protein
MYSKRSERTKQKQNYENGYNYFPQIKVFFGKEKAPQFIFAGGCERLLIVADLNTIFLF